MVLINFWTTWCPGCRDEIPELIRLQLEFESKGFTVVAIAVDDEGARELGFEGGLPASIRVTRDAREVKIIRGPFKAQEVSRAIKHLL